MKYRLINILISLLMIMAINCYEDEDGITVLNDDNYNQALKEFPNLIVKIYSPWCAHCQQLRPEYIEAAKIAKEQQLPIRFAEIDLISNAKTAAELNVEGFPTIKLYQNGESTEFEGERRAEPLIAYIKKKLFGSVFKYSALIEVDEFIKTNRVVLLSTISDNDNASDKKEYYSTADNAEDDINFIECISIECKSKYTSPLVLIRDFNKDAIAFPYKEINRETIRRFIEWYSIEEATMLTDAVVKSFYQYNKTAILLFRDDQDEQQKQLDEVMKRLAKAYFERFHVYIINAKGDDINQRAAEYFFVSEDNQPQIQVLAVSGENDKSYVMRSKEITEENIKQFVTEVDEGKIIKEPLSELIDFKEGLIPLVGRNFVKEVIESNKTVFVLFTSGLNECIDCNDYLNSWYEIGLKYRNISEVNLGAINMEKNEVYGLTLNEYPVMRLYLSNSKDSPIEFKGPTNVIDIEEWMAWKLGWANEPITLPSETETETEIKA